MGCLWNWVRVLWEICDGFYKCSARVFIAGVLCGDGRGRWQLQCCMNDFASRRGLRGAGFRLLGVPAGVH